MDLRHLRYFVSIVDSGSLSAAARELHVAQPALSQHVRRLEQELRISLLDRNSRGVTPTDAGRRLYQEARSLLAQAAQLPEVVRDAGESPSGEVRFGMSGTVGELIGAPLVEAARKRYPGVRLRPVEAMSGYVLDWLRRGEVDLALIYADSEPKGLAAQHLLSEELCLFGPVGARLGRARPGATVSLGAALKLDLITPGRSHGLRELLERGAHSIDNQLTPALEIDSYRQIKLLVLRGMGFGILPETAVRQEIELGLLHSWRIVRPILRRRVYLAHMKERPLSGAARALATMSLELIQELVHSGIWIAVLSPGSDALTLSR